MKVIPETHTKFDIYGFFLDKTILDYIIRIMLFLYLEWWLETQKSLKILKG